MQRSAVLVSLVAIGAFSMTVAAWQQPAARAVLPDLQKVKDNLYFIAASNPVPRSEFTGGNTGVYIADSGVVIVDTKNPGYGADILAKIRAVTPKPVTMLINTHTHGDHSGSNEGFPATVDIVAHENTKANMMKMPAFQGDKAQFLPKRVYKDKLSVLSGKDRIDLYYFGAGHTSGDTWVVYAGLRVLQTGDMFAWKDAPLCDRGNGGSCVEFPKTIAKALAAVKNVDTIIPGHSPLMAPKDLQEYQSFTADLLSTAEAQKRSGKTAEQAAAAFSGAVAKYPSYKSERVAAAVTAIYAELVGK